MNVGSYSIEYGFRTLLWVRLQLSVFLQAAAWSWLKTSARTRPKRQRWSWVSRTPRLDTFANCWPLYFWYHRSSPFSFVLSHAATTFPYLENVARSQFEIMLVDHVDVMGNQVQFSELKDRLFFWLTWRRHEITINNINLSIPIKFISQYMISLLVCSIPDKYEWFHIFGSPH